MMDIKMLTEEEFDNALEGRIAALKEEVAFLQEKERELGELARLQADLLRRRPPKVSQACENKKEIRFSPLKNAIITILRESGKPMTSEQILGVLESQNTPPSSLSNCHLKPRYIVSSCLSSGSGRLFIKLGDSKPARWFLDASMLVGQAKEDSLNPPPKTPPKPQAFLKNIIVELLQKNDQPMTPRQVWEALKSRGLISPAQTLNSVNLCLRDDDKRPGGKITKAQNLKGHFYLRV